MNKAVLSLWHGELLVAVPAPTMLELTRAVAAAHGSSVDELRGHSRERIIVRPRQEAMWACRSVRRPDGSHRYSLPMIAKFFGRDHTTVLHAVRAHARRLEAAQ